MTKLLTALLTVLMLIPTAQASSSEPLFGFLGDDEITEFKFGGWSKHGSEKLGYGRKPNGCL